MNWIIQTDSAGVKYVDEFDGESSAPVNVWVEYPNQQKESDDG